MSDDYTSLIDELTQSRGKLNSYVEELESMMSEAKELFPKKVDYRSKWNIEEKIKTLNEFFGSMLRVRQEIHKTIKDEIELRRKLESGNSNEDEFNIDDIATLAKLADKIEEVRAQKDEEAENK